MDKKKIPGNLRIKVLTRDGYKCLWCGRNRDGGFILDVDHILAEFWGGKTTFDQLGTLCSHCNRAKGTDYFGSYLLTTILKVKNLERWCKKEYVGHNLGRDGDSYRWKIIFHKKDQTGTFREELLEQDYFIGGPLLVTKGIPDTDIKIAQREIDALSQLKDKIRDFLFENKGFLEEFDGKLIFRERK